ncbi:hypothetical protein E2C01_077159 [Portunus trituberculatus]|uniref:Uncharacterized protein n=1 Tax=Portunus trituberculatus TaxID=210409 RepID=A0A5B7IKN3_PORTR|nr:hypothetical protein [Portunus trituberculatus]
MVDLPIRLFKDAELTEGRCEQNEIKQFHSNLLLVPLKKEGGFGDGRIRENDTGKESGGVGGKGDKEEESVGNMYFHAVTRLASLSFLFRTSFRPEFALLRLAQRIRD